MPLPKARKKRNRQMFRRVIPVYLESLVPSIFASERANRFFVAGWIERSAWGRIEIHIISRSNARGAVEIRDYRSGRGIALKRKRRVKP